MVSAKFITTLVIVCLCPVFVDTSDFLFLLPVSTFSHHVYLNTFWQKLITLGHRVTVVTWFTQFKMENVTFVTIKVPYDLGHYLNEKAYGDLRGKPISIFFEMEKAFCEQACESIVSNEVLQHQIKTGVRYDVVFVTSVLEDCNFPVAALLSHKIVVLNFMRQILPVLAYNLGMSTPYAFSPFVASHLSASMSFSERIWNAVASSYYVFWLRKYSAQEKIIQKAFPNAPDLAAAFEKVSLIFSNADDVLSEPVPSTSNVVKIGGMHCKEPKPLPQNIEDILSGENGFILFSLGTLAEMTNAGPHIFQAFVDAFAMLNETVIWKTKENYKNLPPNIKTFPWIPQQDILGHANIRLFISQGGIFGLQEAVYHAVPILGIPLIIDQYSNMRRLDELGIGSHLYMFGNLTGSSIFKAIRNIIDNPSFKKNIDHYSGVAKDISDSPLDRAVFWTEWLTRHPDDLFKIIHPALQSMNIFQFFMLDVLFFLFIIFISPLIILLIAYKSFR